MYRYLSAVTADYTSTEIDIVPQETLTELLEKKQVMHEYDDGSIDVVSFSDSVFFTVTLQWDTIVEEDAAIIFDFYASSTKANGIERTFYITLPDGYTYTARFLKPLKRISTADLLGAGRQGIAQTTLRIEGNKP